MLLTELTRLNNINKETLTEGLVSPELIMMLEKIIKDGKISDMAQVTFICKLLQTLNDPSIINTVTELTYKTITSTEIVNFVKGLEPSKQVMLAKNILVVLYDRNQHYKYNCDKTMCGNNNPSSAHTWIDNCFNLMISARKRN